MLHVKPSDVLAARPAAAARIAFEPPAGNLGWLCLRNFLLSLLTLGLYQFWGRAEARRRLYASIHVDGRPLSYSGTGSEAFRAFLIGLAVVGALVALIAVWKALWPVPPRPPQFRLTRLLISLPLLFLIGSAAYRRRGYMLARTHWAGRAFALAGRAWSYGWLHFWTSFLVPLTLGWALPWRSLALWRRMTVETRHGDQPLAFEGATRPLLGRFLVAWLGVIASYLAAVLALGMTVGREILLAWNGRTLAPLKPAEVALTGGLILAAGLLAILVITAWYRAGEVSHHVSGISIGAERLRLRLPAARTVWVVTSNRLLRLLTLGFASPVADARYARLVVASLTIEPARKAWPTRP